MDFAVQEISGALGLLERLRARRYYRPVFRALPTAEHPDQKMGAPFLAKRFQDPQQRFELEREIERACALPLGSIVVHCPRPHTAEKIASVLIVLDEPLAANPQPYKLRDIGQMDPRVFGDHGQAITAVEKMYQSLWRLVVYAAPEYLFRWREVAAAAGKAIHRVVFGSAATLGGAYPNDPRLEREIEIRVEEARTPHEASILVDHPIDGSTRISPLAYRLATMIEEIGGERLTEVLAVGSVDGPAAPQAVEAQADREALRAEIVRIFGKPTQRRRTPGPIGERRTKEILGIVRPYFAGHALRKHERTAITDKLDGPLSVMPEVIYQRFKSDLTAQVVATPKDLPHARNRLRETLKTIDDLLGQVDSTKSGTE